MKPFVITVAALATLAGAAFAAPAHPAKTAPMAAKKPAARLVCPVTGTKIASVKTAVGHSTYKGKTYYFCCPECKPKFDKNPAKYIKNAAQGKYEAM